MRQAHRDRAHVDPETVNDGLPNPPRIWANLSFRTKITSGWAEFGNSVFRIVSNWVAVHEIVFGGISG